MKLLLTLFLTFFKIGIFSYGGGYVMLPMIYQELEKFGLTMQEFSDVVAISQMTPGPIAVNAATYIGYKSAGFTGAFFATLGISLPSFILIMIIASVIVKFKSSSVISYAFKGIRPATVGMIASAVVFFANTSIIDLSLIEEGFGKIFNIGPIIIFALTIIASKLTKLDPITLTITGGILGIIFMQFGL
ncbi:MAG: chromate transporter [Clostridiaceae bacterium]|nr:chromate transporter [Clostridiaceae bacterium]